MDNIETFHIQTTVVAETVGFVFEANLCKSVPIIIVFVVMDNTGKYHKQKIVVAETVGFRFEADLFKSVAMILVSGCHGQH